MALWQAAHLAFATLMVPLAWMANAPVAVWQQHAPPASAVIVGVVGIAWLAAPRGVPGRALGSVALLPLFVVRPPPPVPVPHA